MPLFNFNAPCFKTPSSLFRCFVLHGSSRTRSLLALFSLTVFLRRTPHFPHKLTVSTTPPAIWPIVALLPYSRTATTSIFVRNVQIHCIEEGKKERRRSIFYWLQPFVNLLKRELRETLFEYLYTVSDIDKTLLVKLIYWVYSTDDSHKLNFDLLLSFSRIVNCNEGQRVAHSHSACGYFDNTLQL